MATPKLLSMKHNLLGVHLAGQAELERFLGMVEACGATATRKLCFEACHYDGCPGSS
jgi:hypothetical protein